MTDIQPEEQEETEVTTKAVPVAQQLVVLAVALLLIFGTGYFPKLLAQMKQHTDTQPAAIPEVPREIPEESEQEEFQNYFEEVAISGKSAFVWDVAGQRVLYEKNPDIKLPLASLTKLMTALVAHEIIAENTTVPISLSAILQDGESGFIAGERFTLETLTDLTLMSSSNDGAFAMASAAGSLLNSTDPASTFIQAMNIRSQELGLTQTYYKNPTGLDISETEAGAYGSARDMAFLMEYILQNKPQILERTTETYALLRNKDGGSHQTKNTNGTVNDIPGIIGSKTGYTELAGGNLTIAFDASLNRPVIVVVLDSTRNERFADVDSLVQATRNNIQQ